MDVPGVDWVVGGGGLGDDLASTTTRSRPAYRAACRALPFGNLVAAAGLGCLGNRVSADCTINAVRVMPALPAILSINSTCLARAVMLIRTVRCASGLT